MATLFLSLVTSGAGFVLFTYGRKQARIPHVVAGLLLMVYPYFVPTAAWMLGVGVAIGVALWWAVREGW